MAKKYYGFIKVSHKFLDHPLYKGDGPFNLKEVLLDLTLRAFYQDTTKTFRSNIRTYQRGQVEGSTRQFCEWWNMSRGTVNRRLKVLQENGFIYVESSKMQTVITLVNFKAEQDFEGLGSTTNRTTDSTTDRTIDSTTNSTTDSTNLKKDKESIYKFKKKSKKINPSDFFTE